MIKNYYNKLTPLLKIRMESHLLTIYSTGGQSYRISIDLKNADKINKKHYIKSIIISESGIYRYNLYQISNDIELVDWKNDTTPFSGRLKIIGVDVI